MKAENNALSDLEPPLGDWLVESDYCRHISSPNFNDRPAQTEVSLLVIHNISLPPGQFNTPHIEQLFCNTLDCQAHPSFIGLEQLQVSAHCLIDRGGSICQFVPFDKRAWHAGESNFEGVDNCNDYSIGIELEGTDKILYTDAQYHRLAQLAKQIMDSFPHITAQRIVGHCDIAPRRKTDPGGAFDWAHFYKLLEF